MSQDKTYHLNYIVIIIKKTVIATPPTSWITNKKIAHVY